MDMNWQAMLHEAANASFEKDIEVRAADDNDAYFCVDLPKAKIRELSEKILHLPQLSHYTCLMVLNICGKENTMKQNNPCYLFGMYEPDTDSVIVNAINNTYTAHLLLSVAKNVIQPSCSIHLMISRIYIGWHRKTFPNLLYYPCHKTKSIIYSLSLVIMKLDIFNPQT